MTYMIIFSTRMVSILSCPNQYSFLIGYDETPFVGKLQAIDRKRIPITKQEAFSIYCHIMATPMIGEKCKKPHSLVITNLISPRIGYKSYGKSGIDLTPFADVIGQTTAKVCHQVEIASIASD